MSRVAWPTAPAFAGLSLPAWAPRPASRPFVLAIEGPNGAGKTTLCQTLSTSLQIPSCLGTDPAWFSDAFKVRMIRDAEWYASAMFFLSGCFEQMRSLRGRPEPAMVMDRSLWSTLAVHAATDPDRLRVLLEMLKPLAAGIEVPDLTLVLEASFATCQKRIATKTGTARALDELTARPEFHAREREFYCWLGSAALNVRFLNVDSLTADGAAAGALGLTRQSLPC